MLAAYAAAFEGQGASPSIRAAIMATMVYYDQRPSDAEKPPGCLDVLMITRAVFGVLLWPIVAMFAVILDLGITLYLYATRPVLALIPIAITAAAIWGFMAWERRRYPKLDP